MTTPQRVLTALEKRDKGRNCAWPEPHPCDPETIVPQHRMGGMGGSKTKHRLSNLVWLCSRINGLIEQDAKWAADARKYGIKVSHGYDTNTEPVQFPDGLFYIRDDGGRYTDLPY